MVESTEVKSRWRKAVCSAYLRTAVEITAKLGTFKPLQHRNQQQRFNSLHRVPIAEMMKKMAKVFGFSTETYFSRNGQYSLDLGCRQHTWVRKFESQKRFHQPRHHSSLNAEKKDLVQIEEYKKE